MKTRLKKIGIIILFIAFAMMPFSYFYSFNSAQNNSKINKNIKMSLNANPAPTTPPVAESPEDIYISYALDPTLSDLSPDSTKFLLNGQDIGNIFPQNVHDILTESWDSINGNSSGIVRPEIYDPFTNKNEVFKLNNEINKFDTNIDKKIKLLIQKPKNAYDILRHVKNNPTSTSNKITIPNDFSYKVAEIHLNDLKEKTTPEILKFDIRLKEADKDSERLTLVIDNEGGKLTNTSNNLSIKNMVDGKYIYLRSDSNSDPLNASSTNKIQSLKSGNPISIKRERDSLFIYVTPNGKDKIEFSVNPETLKASAEATKYPLKDLLGTFDYGYLDNTLSPLHMKKQVSPLNGIIDPTDTILKVSKPDNFINNFDVFHFSKEWDTPLTYATIGQGPISNANVMKFYMAENTPVSPSVYFDGQGDGVFRNGLNKLKISYDGNDFTRIPGDRFQILGGAYQKANSTGKLVSPISIKFTEHSQTLVNGSSNTIKKYVEVEIAFDSNFIHFSLSNDGSNSELPFKVGTPESHIFFENPFPSSSLVTKKPTKNCFIPISEYVDNTQDNNGIIQKVWANWQGLYSSTDSDYMPSTKKYEASYQEYKEDKSSGSLVLQTAAIKVKKTGKEWVDKLNDYTNQMNDWMIEKLGKDPNAVNGNDFYKMDPSQKAGGGWIKKYVLEGIGNKDILEKLDSAATAGKKVFDGKTSNLDATEIKDFPNIMTQVKKGDVKSLYLFVEEYLAKVFTERFKIEKDKFDESKLVVISSHLGAFFNSKQEIVGIDEKLLENFQLDILSEKMNLLALGENKPKMINSGKEQLDTLINFINTFNLQKRFLSQQEATKFDEFVKSKSFTDVELYKSASKSTSSSKVNGMIKLLDKIITGIIPDNSKSLSSIIGDIWASKYKGNPSVGEDTPEKDIASIFNEVIKKIISNEETVQYKFFGREFKSNYLTNLAIGHNLDKVIQRYIRDNKDRLSKTDLAKLQGINGASPYMPEIITRLGINNGYYNLPYFLDGLSKKSEISEVIESLLKSRLEDDISIVLPESSEIINFMANPETITQIGFLASGGMLSIIGMIITFISFKGKKKKNKNIITTRIIFISIAIIGLSLLSLGVLTPSLIGSISALAG